MTGQFNRYPEPLKPASKEIILYAYDEDFNMLGVVKSYTSILWAEERAGAGEFMLVCTDTPENIALLQSAKYYKRPDRKTAMIATYFNGQTRDNQIYVRGRATIERTAQRIVYPTAKIYNAERDMYAMMTANLRGLPRTATAPQIGLSEIYDTQYTGKELKEAIFDICQATGLGVTSDFEVAEKKHIWRIYKGIDRTNGNPEGNPRKVFSTDFGNLTDTIIIKDNSIFKNVAYVAGGGEGEDRTWHIVGTATGEDRHEMYVDARDLQQEENETDAAYLQRLEARGIQRLNERLKVMNFEGDVSPVGFGSDYDLGDLITCQSRQYQLELNTRIERFDEIRENNQTTLRLTLGEPRITQRRLVRAWQS